MRYANVLSWSIAMIFITCSCSITNSQSNKKKPVNIILLIGDGMGLSQVSTTYFYKKEESVFSKFRSIGLIKTSSFDQKITDSAAGATAFSSGIKTYNGAIGVSPDTLNVPTMFEKLQDKNYKTGIVATSSIVHATPAAFYAHVKYRHYYEDIALQLVNQPMDFFAGGGEKFFSQRHDQQLLIDKLQEKNVVVTVDKEIHPDQFNPVKDNKYGFILASDGMPSMAEGRGDFLPDATQMALNHLSKSKEGFFLMVEGSQIDWAGHENNGEYLIQEMLDFDRTIEVALDFARTNKNTLVVVTADHETGGFTLSGQGKTYKNMQPSFSTKGHSATLIPVFAFGIGENKFRGVYENTGIHELIMEIINHNY